MAAVLLHLQILVPLLIVVFTRAKREEAERAEEVDVGFEDVPAEQLPPELPPLDETPPPRGKVPPRTKVAEQKQKQKPPEPEKKPPEPPPPPQVAVKPPPPVPPPKRPPPPLPRAHQKIVELDTDKKVEPPPNAKYLAQENMRAEQETRATHTNLEREQHGPEDQASQAPGQRHDDKEVGDDKRKIAELEEQKSKRGRQAPETRPTPRPSRCRRTSRGPSSRPCCRCATPGRGGTRSRRRRWIRRCRTIRTACWRRRARAARSTTTTAGG